jgi:hypothetical protein
MHINPKGMIGGSPALVVPKAVRYLRDPNSQRSMKFLFDLN